VKQIRRPGSVVVEREPLLPWFAASILVAGAYAGGLAAGVRGGATSWVFMTIAACAVLTATVLVWTRRRDVEEEAAREERGRPATDELDRWASDTTLVTPDPQHHLPPYGEGMLRYSGAVVELLEHAVAVALDHGIDTEELATARDDAAALHDLLGAMAAEPARLDKVAKVHTICSLWEANQDRLETIAAELDPDFHRRWRARNIAVLRLRRGERPRRLEPALPYRE